MKSYILSLFRLFGVMVFCFVLSLVCIQIIPREVIVDNVRSSSELLQEEGDYPYKYKNLDIFTLDNFTDALMLNITVTSDTKHPLDAAMLGRYYESTSLSQGTNLAKSATGDTGQLEEKVYGRYWQGYQVVIRPLLCFFNLPQIRQINHVLMWLLTLCCLYVIRRKIGWFESFLLLIALVRVNLPVIPFSLQYSNCFFQMLLYTILLLQYPQLTSNLSRLSLTFFAIGGLTVFFDFLTTPQITLGIPLILVLLANHQEQKSLCAITASASWALGYSLLWASKWVLGFCITGFNFLSDASTAAQERLSDQLGDTQISFDYLFSQRIAGYEAKLWILALAMMLSVVAFVMLQRNGWSRIKEYGWLLLIALIVPLWYFVLPNHTFDHFWFTRRALLVTFFALMVWFSRLLFHKPQNLTTHT